VKNRSIFWPVFWRFFQNFQKIFGKFSGIFQDFSKIAKIDEIWPFFDPKNRPFFDPKKL
jgi:hypothetical protein